RRAAQGSRCAAPTAVAIAPAGAAWPPGASPRTAPTRCRLPQRVISIDDQLAPHAAHVDLELHAFDRWPADVPVEAEARQPARRELRREQRADLVPRVDLHGGDGAPVAAERGRVLLEPVEHERRLARQAGW